MDRPSSVETVVEEKFKRLQNQKTEWVNMGSPTHQIRIGLEDVIDTDTLAVRFLPIDDPAACLLDLGLAQCSQIMKLLVPFQALAMANFLSIFIPS